jgi:hypothetical protein
VKALCACGKEGEYTEDAGKSWVCIKCWLSPKPKEPNMKAAFLLAGCVLAFSAHAGVAGIGPNVGGGQTTFYDEQKGCPQGQQYLQGSLSSGWAYTGCWFTHGDTVVMLLKRGRDSGAATTPIAAVQWTEGKKPVALVKRSDI